MAEHHVNGGIKPERCLLTADSIANGRPQKWEQQLLNDVDNNNKNSVLVDRVDKCCLTQNISPSVVHSSVPKSKVVQEYVHEIYV